MIDNIIIGLFVAIVIFLHVWLYRWVKFKVDEGTIATLFKDSEGGKEEFSTDVIASKTSIASHRVIAICNKSNDFSQSDSNDSWRYKSR